MKINEVVNLSEITGKSVLGFVGSALKQAAPGFMGAMGDTQSAQTYNTAMRAAGAPKTGAPTAPTAAAAPTAAPTAAAPTKITLPGTNMAFTKTTQWVGPQGQVAGKYSSKVLDQLANGVNPADIPMSDIQRLRQEVGIREDKEKFKW